MRRSEFTDYPFDKEAFRAVIIKARGSKSQAEFCDDCSLSYAYINKYTNGKLDIAPTIQTLKKIAVGTNNVTYEELLTAAGYDAEKYKYDRPSGAERRDLIYPVFSGISNSPYDWKIESSGIKEGEPFEILIERQDVNRWFFVPVYKSDVTKEEILNAVVSQPKFIPGSKLSFVTDNEDVFDKLRKMELPLLSLCISVIMVKGRDILAEERIVTSVKSDISILHKDEIRPFTIGER